MAAECVHQPRIFKIDPADLHPEAIGFAASLLESGGIVLYPTETFYALGAMPYNEGAVERIFRIKGRETDKPLPVIASEREAVLRVASEWPESAERLARRFWPGPLSIVIPADASLASALHALTGKIAVRVSPHPVASLLARQCGGLIVSTSANRAGAPAPETTEAVDAGLLVSVDAVLDAGELPGGLPSTIVDVGVKPAMLLREGRIALGDIRRTLDSMAGIGNDNTGD